MSVAASDRLPTSRDASVRIIDSGRTVIGGSPLQVLRFSAPIDLDAIRSAILRDRLIDAGILHPIPDHGPFTTTDVTVVIPVYDAPEALAATLAGLVACGDEVAEIIVVDDGTPDHETIEAVVAASTIANVRLVRCQVNGGPGAARNAGLIEVATPLVAFLDAGCVPEKGWLGALLAHFADPKLAMVAPRISADPSHTSQYATTLEGSRSRPRSWLRRRVWSAIRDYEVRRSSLDLGAQPARVAPRTRVAYVPSACLLARVDALRDIGGFAEALRVGEDVDLVWRVGEKSRVRYEPKARVTHDIRVQPGAWLRRRFDYGTSAAPLALRHPGDVPPVSISRWTLAMWAAAAFVRPPVGVGIGAGIGAVSTGLLARKLSGLDRPIIESLRLAGLGNLAAGRLLADALRRPWWPLALLGAVFGPRQFRRLVVLAYLAPLVEWRPDIGIDPLSWLALRIADDTADGAGVVAGCLTQRTTAPLIPDFSAGNVG